MPDPLIVRQVVQTATRSVLTLVSGAAADTVARRRRPAADSTAGLRPGEAVEVTEAAFSDALLPPLGGMFTVDAIPPALTMTAVSTEMAGLPPLGENRLGDNLAPPLDPMPLPDDLFAPVVGLDYEKRILRTVVTSDRQLHALIVGDPGTAKSLLLEELRRLPDSRYIVGRTMTSSGLLEVVLDDPSGMAPKILLIDEIDKANPDVLSTLLALMTGKATRAVHGKHQEVDVDIRVVMAANSVDGKGGAGRRPLHPALLSRAIELHLQPYTAQERHDVIAGFLERRQGVEPGEAARIAALVAPHSSDVRDAEQIATVAASDPALAAELATRLHRSSPAATPVRARKHRVVDKRRR